MPHHACIFSCSDCAILLQDLSFFLCYWNPPEVHMQGWLKVDLLQKEYTCKNLQMLTLFQDIVPLHYNISSIILASCWCQLHKRFCHDCIASSGHCIWVHRQFEISLPPSPLLVKQMKTTGGYVRAVRRVDHDFPAHCCQCHLRQICHMRTSIVMQ